MNTFEALEALISSGLSEDELRAKLGTDFDGLYVEVKAEKDQFNFEQDHNAVARINAERLAMNHRYQKVLDWLIGYGQEG